AIPQVAPIAVRQMPHATLVKMEGLGHAPQVEAPDRFNATLLAILRGPATAAAPPVDHGGTSG
ncbi:MAG: alpha/beta fold hydrolase, partial [Janthinobacterium lividum]